MYPYLEINLDKLFHNSASIHALCQKHGIDFFGVTKVCGAIPEVGYTMLAGGAQGLADSRLTNLQKLRDGGISAPLMLIRSPAISEVTEVVAFADISLNSELVVLEHLSQEAERQDAVHQVILMVDLGDLREGVWDKQILKLYAEAQNLPHIEVVGIGTNLTCLSGTLPQSSQLDRFGELVQKLNTSPLIVSGGSSSAIHLLAQGKWEERWSKVVNQLRIGESIFLGWDIITHAPLPGFYQDACLVHAEIIEVQHKPESSSQKRALVALGKQDIGAGQITPTARGVEVLGITSDHTVVDLKQHMPGHVGAILTFRLDYEALLATSITPYVTKKIKTEVSVNIADQRIL